MSEIFFLRKKENFRTGTIKCESKSQLVFTDLIRFQFHVVRLKNMT